MNMTMMTIKGRKTLWGLLLLPILVFIFTVGFGDVGSPTPRQLELQTFQSGNGWGYKIVAKGKTLIYQPTIPAIDTIMPFQDEASAKKVGSLVLKRLNRDQNISVSKEEISHLISR